MVSNLLVASRGFESWTTEDPLMHIKLVEVPSPPIGVLIWRGMPAQCDIYKHSLTLEVFESCGSPVVKVSGQGRHVMSSNPVPLKTRRVGQRSTVNLSRAETSSHGGKRWCQLRCRPRHLTMAQNYVVRRQKALM
ncbi:uncharacterized protein TNCV_653341 [Trichonephila clavipes]|nr:uncharacterized protein TNCV_653341 [Trichonephila clavipes]